MNCLKSVGKLFANGVPYFGREGIEAGTNARDLGLKSGTSFVVNKIVLNRRITSLKSCKLLSIVSSQ